jgi:hypothetical protein
VWEGLALVLVLDQCLVKLVVVDPGARRRIALKAREGRLHDGAHLVIKRLRTVQKAEGLFDGVVLEMLEDGSPHFLLFCLGIISHVGVFRKKDVDGVL